MAEPYLIDQARRPQRRGEASLSGAGLLRGGPHHRRGALIAGRCRLDGRNPTIGVLFAGGVLTGASRTLRDVMVKDEAPPAQIGKVFAFVSSGMPLGGAIMPVPYGIIIDAGRPDLVLVVVAALLLATLCASAVPASACAARVPVAAE